MRDKEIVSIIVPVRNERENLEALIRSIYEQSYRPIEVVAVDGGSTDGTLEMLEKLKGELNGKEFQLKILRERDFGELRSPANARNIGIKNSSGEYIIFLDADMILLDRDFIKKVKEGLDKSPWVSVKIKPLIDSAVEQAIVVDKIAYDSLTHEYCCVRRSIFNYRMFDPHLGFGEDRDFFNTYLKENLGIKPVPLDTFIGSHEPHTIEEFIARQKWYGRTTWLYARKNFKPIHAIMFTLRPLRHILYILLAIVILALSPLLGVISSLLIITLAVLFIIKRINFYLKVPPEHRSLRLLLLVTFLDILLGPVAYGMGLFDYLKSALTGRKPTIGRD